MTEYMLVIVLIGLVATLGSILTIMVLDHKNYLRKPHQFQYSCKVSDCSFSCGGTDPAIVDYLATVHERGHQ